VSVAVVTGGGRGIGANVARALAADGWDVVVTARTQTEIDQVAAETGGRAIVVDVADRDSVARGFAEIGHVDLLIANAGVGTHDLPPEDVDRWWHTFEVNVLGVHLCCNAAAAAGASRIVIVGSGAAYLPGASDTAYTASKAAVCRYAETLNNAVGFPVFLIAPGLVRTALTEGHVPDDAPWTPPELAPELVRKLATGRYDALAGRYIHAERDDVDDLLTRIDEVRERDLQAIRLQR
jgi:NAD(P)-dependent dehydrogenase (short-subunit alcohol dehydrogenase family)